MNQQINNKIIDFVRAATTIEVYVCDEIDRNLSMWPGIAMYAGKISVNIAIAHPGDLLHELGHVATCPKEAREFLDGEITNLGDIFLDADEDVDKSRYLKDPYLWSNDQASSFWAYCIAKHLSIDTSLPFMNGYGDQGLDNWRYLVAGIGSPMGSSFSVQAYYLGLIENKADGILKKWEI